MKLPRWLPRWRRDPHRWPHPMKNGGCYCTCRGCIQQRDGWGTWRCICPRCNQDCTGLGRLGHPEGVRAEQLDGYPVAAPAASRWVRVR